MNNIILEKIINNKLNSNKYYDFSPNGLQIEGRSNIKKIITGVSACQILLDKAVEYNADAIIVHHGYFWKKDPLTIKGIHRKRLKTILSNNINLYSWHLPLDGCKTLGNNIQIAKKLKIKIQGEITQFLMWGYLKKSITGKKLSNIIATKFSRIPFYYNCSNKSKIRKIAWCSGKGQSFISHAAQFGVDAFLTGEVSEETIHLIREYKLHFFSAGHHATEKDGIKQLGNWIIKNYHLDVIFIDVDNPI